MRWRKDKQLMGVLALSLIITISLVVYLFVVQPYTVQPSAKAPVSENILASNNLPDEIAGRYMFSGTIVLARGIQSAANGDYAQPFSKFDTFNPDQYDAWVADLECPVTGESVPYQRQVESLIFNCDLAWLPELHKHIGFLNLANNHTEDMGSAAFLETQNNLDEAGFQIVGNYRPTVTQDNCEVMSFPVRLLADGELVSKASLPIGVCAFHYFSFSPSAGELEEVRELSKVMPVISLMHVGVEYLPLASGKQVEVAHKLIDYGSEFVIGNSPHWVQDSEVYKGKLIVYSTGNFIFDQLDVETNRGLNMDVRMSVPYSQAIKGWLDLAEQCVPRNDTCAELVVERGLEKYTPRFTYTPVASLGGYGVLTQKADPSTQAAVEERLNWKDTLQKLGQQ